MKHFDFVMQGALGFYITEKEKNSTNSSYECSKCVIIYAYIWIPIQTPNITF